MSVAAGARLHNASVQNSRHSSKLCENGGANILVFPFVCHNYCKRDKKCRKVEAGVHNMWEKEENFIP